MQALTDLNDMYFFAAVVDAGDSVRQQEILTCKPRR